MKLLVMLFTLVLVTAWVIPALHCPRLTVSRASITLHRADGRQVILGVRAYVIVEGA
jgi:hypothetical protein